MNQLEATDGEQRDRAYEESGTVIEIRSEAAL
jgi:hypothetical protein